jgi:hypothetical protein
MFTAFDMSVCTDAVQTANGTKAWGGRSFNQVPQMTVNSLQYYLKT